MQPGQGIPRARAIEAQRQAIINTVMAERHRDDAYLIHEVAALGPVDAMKESVGKRMPDEEADELILSSAKCIRDRSNSVRPGDSAEAVPGVLAQALADLALADGRRKSSAASAPDPKGKGR